MTEQKVHLNWVQKFDDILSIVMYNIIFTSHLSTDAGYAIPAICSFLLNWSPNSDVTLAIFAIYTAFTSIAVTVIISVMVELMPTSLRFVQIEMWRYENLSIGASNTWYEIKSGYSTLQNHSCQSDHVLRS